jgi:hypothetical protein
MQKIAEFFQEDASKDLNGKENLIKIMQKRLTLLGTPSERWVR